MAPDSEDQANLFDLNEETEEIEVYDIEEDGDN